MSDSGDEFQALKPSLRRAIDTAFLKLVKQSRAESKPARKKRRIEEQDVGSDSGGLVKGTGDEEHGSEGHSDNEEEQGVPLSLVPTGLQMLDLPPDDEEVLTVFRNAATGWETRLRAPPRGKQADSDQEEPEVDRDAGLVVGRDDWRAVCAVLVGQREDVEVEVRGRKASGRASEVKGQASGSKRPAAQKPSIGEEPEPRVTRRQTRAAAAAATETKARSDSPEGGFIVQGPEDDEAGGFVPASDDEGGGGFAPASDDEEQEGSGSDVYSDLPPSEPSSGSEFGGPTRQRISHGKAAAKDDDSDLSLDEDTGADMPLTLTARQEREARLAFALFFPGVETDDPGLATKKIGIREVADAAKVLKEKLSTDDIIEMLSMFSSGPAGAVGLEEFGRMAVMAKLI
ncbi:hypothetical protein BDV93DRAFT_554535 [Ceratobasidium sp. AG-I]|nr:hypothetical protein BDV93DRAFT_554535 [Ceratobasidium sp. AG-I]